MKKKLMNLDERIARSVMLGIERGEYRPGERLPTERGLAEQYGVQRMTARAALERLVNRGDVAVRSRDGYFVLPRRVRLRLEAHGDLAQSFEPGEFAWADERTADLIVSEALARRAFFPAGASTRRIARTGLYLGEPVLAETRLLPEGLSAEDAAAGGTTGASYTSCSLDIAYAAPDGAERLGAGAPLVVARIHAYGGDGRILCYRELALRADVFEFES